MTWRLKAAVEGHVRGKTEMPIMSAPRRLNDKVQVV